MFILILKLRVEAKVVQLKKLAARQTIQVIAFTLTKKFLVNNILKTKGVFMKVVQVVLIILMGSIALASAKTATNPADYKPKEKVIDKELTIAAVDAALRANPSDLNKFMTMKGSSEKITDVTVTKASSGVITYKFKKQNCTEGGFVGNKCFGKGDILEVRTQKGLGGIITSESRYLPDGK